MKFENPPVREDLNPNVPHEHPLREAWRLLCWGAGLLLVLWLVVRLLVWSLPSWVSIEDERRWFRPLMTAMTAGAKEDPALQSLADTLADSMQLPPGAVRVSVVESSSMQAFATLGGQVVLTSRLLQCLPSKDAVAAVLAHEMAHVAHRDPLRASSHGMLSGLVSAAVFGNHAGMGVVQQLASLRFSREMEEVADGAAVHLLAARQGSVRGVIELFETLYRLENPAKVQAAKAGRPGAGQDGAGLHTQEGTPGTDTAQNVSATREGRASGANETQQASSSGEDFEDWLADLGWFSTHPDLIERMAGVRRLAARHGYALTAPHEPNPWRVMQTPVEGSGLDCTAGSR